MLLQKITSRVLKFALAAALIGCTADGEPSEDELAQSDQVAGADESADVAGVAQSLGNFARVLPKRGSDNGIVESKFLSWGMLYSMQLRTGALVDAVSASFYTPSNADNRFRPGDPVFTRGPAGGTAGSPAPLLQCPGGFAASGVYGRSGNRLDMLGLICSQIAGDGRPLKSTERAVGAYGGPGGTFFFDTCDEGEWLAGLMVQVAMKASGTNKIVSSVQGYCASAR